jgi:CubicO group peptidase (beta-lactamase class C family)
MPESVQASAFPIPAFTDQTRPEKLSTVFPEVDAIFEAFRDQRHIPGLAFGIIMDGSLVYAKGIGFQKADERTPVTPHSVFRIASMSKSFAAMAIIKLRDEGKLRFDDPAVNYVPELASLAYPTRDSTPITVRQLLTMGAGFPQDDPWADRQLNASEEQLSEWLHSGISFSNPPGLTFEYSNYSYALLGRIVTNVAGIPYQRYIKQSILEPLRMASSTYDINKVSPERLAIGHRLEDNNKWTVEPPLADGTFGAMGGLFTTITDFARYMAFLLSAFPPRDEPEVGPIRRSSAREMMQAARLRLVHAVRPRPDAPAWITSDGYGYGLVASIDSQFGYTVAHGGGLPGYGTFYRLLPHSGIGVVAFTNLTYTPAAIPINDTLSAMQKAGALTPRMLPTAPILASYQETINQLYEQWNDDKAMNIATDTFWMDMPIEKRREQFQRLHDDLGSCVSVTPFDPQNALRGQWVMQCERGRIEFFMTLAPTVPPLVQYLIVTGAKSPGPKMRRAVMRLLRLIRDWNDVTFRAVFAPQVKRADIFSQLNAVRVQYGDLKMGDTLSGDGEMTSTIRLNGTRDNVDLLLIIDPKKGKIRQITFSRPQDTMFVP